jgi:predicted amidophosphoribosyltransferase
MTFKLGGERRSAPSLADYMARAVRIAQADLLTFVPSSRRAMAQRGYNPAAELARALAPRLQIPVRPLLEKVRETSDQAELGRDDRHRNLRDAFRARRVAGPVLLIDDVMTTGATAHACSLALRMAGASRVAVLTFARAR